MGRDMGLWNNQKRMVANFSNITQWDTMPGNISADDGKAQAKEFRKILSKMDKNICVELPAKTNMHRWENGMRSEAAKRTNAAYRKRMGTGRRHFTGTSKGGGKEQ